MKNIIESIKLTYPVSNDSIELLKSKLTKHVFPKKSLIIEGGRLDKHIYFIEKGITRSYCLVDGDEITTWFSKEGDVTFGLLDVYRGEPGFEYVETLEETEAYSISVSDMNDLYRINLDIANWSRIVHQECVLTLQLTRLDSLSLSAKERHDELLKRIPDICNRVNLSYIASFLGITNSTLSRIRTLT